MREVLDSWDPLGAKRKANGPTLDFDFTGGAIPDVLTFARAGTATYFDSNGVMQTAAAGAARLDHDPVTKAVKGILLESSRTNQFLHSQDFANAAWTKARITLTANANVAPDGTMTGTRIQETAEASTKVFQQSQTFAAGSQTVSIYAKAGERNWFYIGISNGGTFSAHFNLTDGTIGTTAGVVTAKATHVGNGWYRCTLTWTAVAGSGIVFFRIASASNTTVYTGDGVSGLYVWGSQDEAGIFASSYIPTTSGSVTRLADTLELQGVNFTNWIHADKGSMFVEFIGHGIGLGCGVVFMQQTTAPPRHQITYGTGGAVGAAVVDDTGTVVVSGIGPAGNVPHGTLIRVAYGYADNDFAMARDGLAAATDNSGVAPRLITILRLGFANGVQLNGHLRKFKYWPTRLTNDQLRVASA